MKVSDYPFISWDRHLTVDSFPYNIRFNPNNEFFIEYCTYNSWGGDSWSYYGVFEDTGQTLCLEFRETIDDTSPFNRVNLNTPFSFESSYEFVGDVVRFAVNPVCAFLSRREKAPIDFFFSNFIHDDPFESDDDA